MFKKTMTYTDYDGNERTENFYFNLTKAEVMEMELTTSGGLEAYINKIISEQNTAELCKLFKDLLLKSYGEKSLDGKRFVKTPELTQAFMQTEAYSDLFYELATNSDLAAEFVNGITPQVPQDHLAPKQKKIESIPDARMVTNSAVEVAPTESNDQEKPKE